MIDQDRGVVVRSWMEIPPEDVRRGVRRRAFGTPEVMLVMNELEPEMDTAPHVHEGFDQIALIISGRGICHIGGVGHNVGPGSVMLIPAGVEHYLQPAGDEMITNLDVFAPARADFAHLVTWMQDAPVTTGQS